MVGCSADFVVAEFRTVAHVPVLSRTDQPTVAIVTLLYCEKLAVDAMIDYKTTYFRCKKAGHISLTFSAQISISRRHVGIHVYCHLCSIFKRPPT